ncbi:MAG: hypothetical protein ACXQT4_00570 [Methanotrichaceae archaeon]
MMHKGDRIKGGDMPDDLIEKADGLMDQFVDIVDAIIDDRKLQKGVVRSQLPCSIVLVLDKATFYVVGQYHAGTLSTMYTYHPDKQISEQKIQSSARWEFGFEDPFVIVFPKEALDENEKERYDILNVIAITYVESEVQRALNLMSLMQIRPLFGHASYIMDDRLACVLVPPTESGTKIYEDAIKPVMENGGVMTYRAKEFGEDEKKLKRVWREICISRIVVADLTGVDPMVMYELGIAHTVGKETLVLYRRGECPQFPAELVKAHLIEYDETEEGMKTLRSELAGAMNEFFSRVID